MEELQEGGVTGGNSSLLTGGVHCFRDFVHSSFVFLQDFRKQVQELVNIAWAPSAIMSRF